MSFGQRRTVESFGRPTPVEGLDQEEPAGASAAAASVGTVYVDIKINPGSLARLQEELARAVCAAVETGFARAGAMDNPEQT
jgi:hypothetical protein